MVKMTFITTFVLTLFLGGCQKDELTLPTNVDFVFTLNPFEIWNEDMMVAGLKSCDQISADNLQNNGQQIDSLIINKVRTLITSIEIEGKREQGEDVFLVSEFDPPLSLLLSSDKEISNSQLSFDIPQGIYKKLDIQFYMGNKENPAMDFTGTLYPGDSSLVKFSFSYIPEEKIKVRAIHGNRAEDIVLDKNKKSEAKIIIDAGYLFQNFTLSHLTDADAVNTDNGKEIKISNMDNRSIFGLLTGRLEMSIAVVFE